MRDRIEFVYRITQVLSVGRYATLERAVELRAAGVTHILNVSDAPSQVMASENGFREVVWVPVDDFKRLPKVLLRQALDTLHRLSSETGAHVYIHCVAGQLRSPTILWLYLIACGVPPENARIWIEERSPDAAPGARRIVDHHHISFAQMHGLNNFFPLPRSEIIVPVALEPRVIES
jgi:protein-tyrosine phosphatase